MYIERVDLSEKDNPRIIQVAASSLRKEILKRFSVDDIKLVDELIEKTLEACMRDKTRAPCFMTGAGSITGSPISKVMFSVGVVPMTLSSMVTNLRKKVSLVRLNLHEKVLIGSLLDNVYKCSKQIEP